MSARRLLWLLPLAVVGAGLWWWLRPGPPLPAVALEGADPVVARAVRRLFDEVRAQPAAAAVWGRLGMTLMANQFEQEAVGPLTQAEKLNPKDPRWPYLQGVALLGYRPDDALPCLRRAVALCVHPGEQAVGRLRLAEALAANGYEDEAETHFREVPADSPLAACADLGRAALAAARGDLDGSKRLLANCADNPLTRQRAAMQRAALARRQGETTTPTRSGSDPAWPDPFLAECLSLAVGREGRLRQANALEAQGQRDQAIRVLREQATDTPDVPTLLALGITLGRGGHFAESEQTLRRCLDLEPQLVRAHYYLSLALFGQGEAAQRASMVAEATRYFERSAAAARQAAELAPHNGEAHFQAGLALNCLERASEAIAAFRRAVAARPELPDPHLWLGKALAAEGKKDEALTHLRHAVRLASPDDARPRQALEALERGDKP